MNKEHSPGFTLIELMIVLAIVAITLTIGVPSFQSYTQNTRKTSSINDLRGALALARSSAITRRERVTVCKSTDNTNCTDAGDWTQGWIVFADPNNRGNRDDGEEILRAHGRLSGDGIIAGNRLVANRVSFTPEGMADGSLGTLTYTDSRGAEYGGALVISFGGNVRYVDGRDSSSTTSSTN